MNPNHDSPLTQPVYRIDKFVVPDRPRAEFLAKVRETQQILREIPGCVDEAVYEQTDGPGRFNVITMVTWQSAQAMESAKKVMAERQARDGFRPNEFLEKLGVSGDIGIYRRA
jgi:heme-degrading monooxygenase HmoA